MSERVVEVIAPEGTPEGVSGFARWSVWWQEQGEVWVKVEHQNRFKDAASSLERQERAEGS